MQTVVQSAQYQEEFPAKEEHLKKELPLVANSVQDKPAVIMLKRQRRLRAKMKAARNLLEKACSEAVEKNTGHKKQIIQKRVYLGVYRKLLGLPAKDLSVEWENSKRKIMIWKKKRLMKNRPRIVN
ncbi:hypothetical protein ZHAS_00015023 [Anopheles sinensis]|uniref:Uncharacterized protein n=1 Tax=Anopheles sinensis TaxID=74873 RepID=A0A084W9W6_ANOSI|nr:hypothetical protein ZHAS_00015023 [Anopheles sinensis]